MRIGSGPVPTPIVSSARVEDHATRVAAKVVGGGPQQGSLPQSSPSDTLVVEMTGSHLELLPGELVRVVDKLNDTARIFNHALQFQVGEDRVVVRVINTESGTVVREIPPENLLDVFDRLEQFVGLLLDQRI